MRKIKTKLTHQQAFVSRNWPRHTFHAVHVKTYRDSRLIARAAAKLGLSWSYSGQLMILWPETDNPVATMIYSAAARMIRRLESPFLKLTDEEVGARREFLHRWCPESLPAFDYVHRQYYV